MSVENLASMTAIVAAIVGAATLYLKLFVRNEIAASNQIVLNAVANEYASKGETELQFSALRKDLDDHIARCHGTARRK